MYSLVNSTTIHTYIHTYMYTCTISCNGCVLFVEQPEGDESLEQFCDSLQKFTRFNSFRELATLTYGDQTNNCCIVSSIEFDRDGEFFAVAGVTKKIKVYNDVYQRVGRLSIYVGMRRMIHFKRLQTFKRLYSN